MSNDTVIAKAVNIPEKSNVTDIKSKTPAPAPAPAESLFRPGPEIPEQPNPLLVSILRTKRAHTSAGDINFRLWLHAYLEQITGKKPQIWEEGCVVVQTDTKSDTLFSCHMDTVHSNAESNGSFQDLAYDPTFGHIVLAPGSTSGCLGADDGAGIYVLLRMIESKVPGSYIFHTGEERGGIGATAMLAKRKDWLDNFSRAIAFDRAVQQQDSPEVICSQGGVPCASLQFGGALVDALNAHSALFADDWVISHKGTFTDTKVYRGVIPECVNLGVFYARQHSPQEFLDVAHLESLVTAACKIKWDDLKATRKPEADAIPAYSYKKGKQNSYKGASMVSEDEYWENLYRERMAGTLAKTPAPAVPAKKVPPPEPTVLSPLDYLDELDSYTKADYLSLVEDTPDMAAAVLAVLVAKYKASIAELDVLHAFMSES